MHTDIAVSVMFKSELVTGSYNLYTNSSAATPVVTSLYQSSSSSQFTLICTSTTSPATTVMWTKDGTTLSFDGTPYQHSQVVTNRQFSTYDNVLTSVGDPASVAGYYTCTVSNIIGSSRRGFQVKGQFTDMPHASITESVDSVCRDGTDMPYVAIQTEAWKTLLKQQL